MFKRALALAAALFCSAAFAYPDKPLRLIVPFPAGDGLDTQGRMIADRLGARLGQKVIVDNRAGAGTLICVVAAKQSAGDSHTLLLVTTTYAINPSLRLKVPYDPLTDFLPVIQTTAIPLVVVGSPSFAPNNFAEVLALAQPWPCAGAGLRTTTPAMEERHHAQHATVAGLLPAACACSDLFSSRARRN
jgi:tripartite-type tricarboxylate transporter receptor subunit TctC